MSSFNEVVSLLVIVALAGYIVFDLGTYFICLIRKDREERALENQALYRVVRAPKNKGKFHIEIKRGSRGQWFTLESFPTLYDTPGDAEVALRNSLYQDKLLSEPPDVIQRYDKDGNAIKN